VDHLLKHLGAENLSRQEVVFEQTLGTGSIAQVALFRIRGAQRLMKMTWPEDEEHYSHDFRTFKRWQRISWGGSKFTWAMSDLRGEKLEKFRVFIQAVITKERDIFNEFDMAREFGLQKKGLNLLTLVRNTYSQRTRPSLHLSHSVSPMWSTMVTTCWSKVSPVVNRSRSSRRRLRTAATRFCNRCDSFP